MKQTKRYSILIQIICLLFTASTALAQNCNCNISEVENNTVTPCTIIIGIVDTVATVNEFKSAVSQANNSGGNMTILIADGTYQIASTSSFPYITASNVVFRSLSGNRDNVILTGAGMTSVSPLVESGFYIVGNNVTIADLTIKDLGNHGIAATGDSLFVHNVKIQNTYEQMIKGNSANNGPDYGRVQCSLFEYPAGVGPQFYIGGLDIHDGDNWVVNDNIFKNIASPSGSLAEHAIHFWDSSSTNIVERNMMINCDRGIGFGLGSSPSDGGIIRNNMIYNDGIGLFNDVGIGLETSAGTKVYNNTIFIDYPNAIEYRFAATTNVDITNNLTNKAITSRNGGQATLTTNIINAPSSWFVNTAAGDLHLISSNPAVVDQGTILTDVTIDFDQTPRPQGNLFDIGAHEFLQFTSVNDIKNAASNIIVFPNPATNTVSIKSTAGSISDITIYNFMGQTIAFFENINSTSEFIIDVSKWRIGIYVCHIIDNDQYESLVRIAVSK